MEGAGLFGSVVVALGAGTVTFLLAVWGRGRAAMWVTAGLIAAPFAFGLVVEMLDRHATAGLGALVLIAVLFVPALLGAAVGWGLGAWLGLRR